MDIGYITPHRSPFNMFNTQLLRALNSIVIVTTYVHCF